MLLGPILATKLGLATGSTGITSRKGPFACILSDAPRVAYARTTEDQTLRHSVLAVRPKRVVPLGPLVSASELPVAASAVTISAVATLGMFLILVVSVAMGPLEP